MFPCLLLILYFVVLLIFHIFVFQTQKWKDRMQKNHKYNHVILWQNTVHTKFESLIAEYNRLWVLYGHLLPRFTFPCFSHLVCTFFSESLVHKFALLSCHLGMYVTFLSMTFSFKIAPYSISTLSQPENNFLFLTLIISVQIAITSCIFTEF